MLQPFVAGTGASSGWSEFPGLGVLLTECGLKHFLEGTAPFLRAEAGRCGKRVFLHSLASNQE